MHTPHKKGSLSYRSLEFIRERVCPRCKQDLRVRNHNELCKACLEDPARIEASRLHYNRLQAKAAKRRYWEKKGKQ